MSEKSRWINVEGSGTEDQPYKPVDNSQTRENTENFLEWASKRWERAMIEPVYFRIQSATFSISCLDKNQNPCFKAKMHDLKDETLFPSNVEAIVELTSTATSKFTEAAIFSRVRQAIAEHK